MFHRRNEAERDLLAGLPARNNRQLLLRPGGPVHTERLAFTVVGCIGLASVAFFLRISPDAGAEVSGRGKLARS
ncbi:MAG TPA: hypothetical protein VG651_02670 [Stellaceae bacterium]|nr:hypothetical protein [Stellaceae bacterium]